MIGTYGRDLVTCCVRTPGIVPRTEGSQTSSSSSSGEGFLWLLVVLLMIAAVAMQVVVLFVAEVMVAVY